MTSFAALPPSGLLALISDFSARLTSAPSSLRLRHLRHTSTGAARNITATTLVLTHNWLGRTYLAVIMPFHRLIVPAMLRKAGG